MKSFYAKRKRWNLATINNLTFSETSDFCALLGLLFMSFNFEVSSQIKEACKQQYSFQKKRTLI